MEHALRTLRNLSLLHQFALAAALVLGITMVVLGSWVSHRIEAGVLKRTAEVGALYMGSTLEPLVQELAHGRALSPPMRAAIEGVTQSYALRRHVLSIKIWKPDGTIAFSSIEGLEGRRFETREIQPALAGQVVGFLGELEEDENAYERTLGVPIYEIYGPIYEKGTKTVIAVGEFYEDATRLKAEIADAVSDSWVVIGGASFCMLLALCGIVSRGSRTIELQRRDLRRKYRQQMRLHASNERLQARIRDALRQASRIDQRLQKRVGAELHDGPVQLLAYVLLRMDVLEAEVSRATQGGAPPDAESIQKMRRACSDALNEIRAISTGLFVAFAEPGNDLAGVIGRVVTAHGMRFDREIRYVVEAVPADPPDDVLDCLARVAQEALTNAEKYAPNAKVTVTLAFATGRLRLEIADDGPGLPPRQSSARDDRVQLGIAGMTYRAEALGGTLRVSNQPQGGTCVECILPVDATYSERSSGNDVPQTLLHKKAK